MKQLWKKFWTVGTRSVLFGAHCWFLHPWFVAWAWWKLYGFPKDYRLWVAFFVHDLGYVSLPNMDGAEGESHVEWGAWFMHYWFDPQSPDCDWPCKESTWLNFCRYHSRFYAKRDGQPYSRLCVADKLAICLTPWWLYLPLVNLSGEVHEYMARATQREGNKYASANINISSQREWYQGIQKYMRKWVEEHKDLRPDTWTPITVKEGAE